jgi:DNA-directed RNA polymerase subunit RPC12/RpoP
MCGASLAYTENNCRAEIDGMPDLHEQSVNCPYCGETIFVLIDDSLPQQNYI